MNVAALPGLYSFNGEYLRISTLLLVAVHFHDCTMRKHMWAVNSKVYTIYSVYMYI